MKTAISLPDDLFGETERLARRLGKSRSELYRDALGEYLARHDLDAVTEAINDAVDQGAAAREPFGGAAAQRVLERTEW